VECDLPECQNFGLVAKNNLFGGSGNQLRFQCGACLLSATEFSPMATVTTQQAFALALQHHAAGRLGDAEMLYRQILAAQPGHAEAQHHLGIIAHQSGDNVQAVEWIRRAIALQADNPNAHSNLGNALLAQGRHGEAVAAYERALALNPGSAEAHFNLGNALREQGRLDEAIAAYRRALERKPGYAGVHNNLGAALAANGQIDEAIAAYRRELALQPGCPWVHSNLAYVLHFHPDCDEEATAAEHRRWNQQIGEPLKRLIQPHPNDRDPERRLRIGYVSLHFREHVVGLNLRPLFERHDRRDFEILCYSGVTNPDRLTGEFQEKADEWRSTVNVSDEALAKMIRDDRVDILVDLTQHLAGNRLPVFARQPAPVQVSFAGYPAGTGLEAIGYRMSDRYLERHADPEVDAEVMLLDSFWCYHPGGATAEVNTLPARENGWVTFGSLNDLSKANEAVLRTWVRVLRQVKNSRLVLLGAAGSHRPRTLDVLQREGIEAQRVEFVDWCPREVYLELYHRLDIALDTFPYSGHTTSLDALWMGVPVVSLAGPTPVARGGLSILHNAGLPELVGYSKEDYVRIAVGLAGDGSRLAELRATLRSRMAASVLMDAPRFARSIENAYRTMWRCWCEKNPSCSR